MKFDNKWSRDIKNIIVYYRKNIIAIASVNILRTEASLLLEVEAEVEAEVEEEDEEDRDLDVVEVEDWVVVVGLVEDWEVEDWEVEDWVVVVVVVEELVAK